MTQIMKAMILEKITMVADNPVPLKAATLPVPVPAENEMLIKVSACGVCHTELDEIEGRTSPPQFPVVLGHQIIGRVEQKGGFVTRFKIGDRVGVGWINSSCGKCIFCLTDRENLCDSFKATGRDVNGGYAEYTVVSEEFAFKIPEVFDEAQAAPLLCAGAIGYRSIRLSKITDGYNIGFIGFGASAHIAIQIVRHLYPNSKIFVFARSARERAFAQELGAFWAGDIDDTPPEKLYAAIDTTPVWTPILHALRNLDKDGRLVINAIRKEDIDKNVLVDLDYPTHLWAEKEIKTVANVARKDILEFLELAGKINLKVEIQRYKLEEANQALLELKNRKIRGAKVIIVD